MRRLSICVALYLIIFAISGASSRTDPETGRVRVLYVGEVTANDLYRLWLLGEPRFSVSYVTCDIQTMEMRDAKRMCRLYLPRTEEELFEENDVTIFKDFTPDVLPLRSIGWFQSSIEKGMGIALIEFVFWGGTNDIHKWQALSFYDVFPAKPVINDIPAAAGRTFYDVVNEDGPLDLPGIQSVPMNGGHHGDMVPRQNTVVEANWRGRGTPAMVTSTYGEGNTLQLGHGWDNIPGSSRVDYRYMIDYIFNQLFYAADLPYPEDLETVHGVRELFITYQTRKRATIGVLEFVDQFGADTREIERKLGTIQGDYGQAVSAYMEARYEAALETLEGTLDDLTDLESEMLEAKERALLWVYVVEWAAVTGTLMICGFVVWSLMVQRRLYSEVGTTRASKRGYR